MPATRTIDCSARINGERVFGTIYIDSTGERYKGDIEQCDDCGNDDFTLVPRAHVMASMAQRALRCSKCGAVYDLRCEE